MNYALKSVQICTYLLFFLHNIFIYLNVLLNWYTEKNPRKKTYRKKLN